MPLRSETSIEIKENHLNNQPNNRYRVMPKKRVYLLNGHRQIDTLT